MSTAARLISGSAASWTVIAVTMISQIALVPIFLSYWSVETYGIWLAVQGIMSVLSMLDLGHQNYIGYEFLRLGKNNMLELSKYLWSAIVFSIIISLVQIALIVIFFFSGILTFLLGETEAAAENVALLQSAGITLIVLGISWLINTTLTGLLTRVLAGFGYYPRMAWWGVVMAIATALSPLFAVLMGAGLVTTS